jgi:hypothetical protein
MPAVHVDRSSTTLKPDMERRWAGSDSARQCVAESFFASLKAEIGTKVWATRAEAHKAVFAYLTYYNRNRLHSTLKCRTPYEARVCYRQPIAFAA